MTSIKKLIAALTLNVMLARVQQIDEKASNEEKENVAKELSKIFLETLEEFNFEQEEALEYFHFDLFPEWLSSYLLNELKKFYQKKI